MEAFALTPLAPPLRACGDLEAELRPTPLLSPTLDHVGPDALPGFFAEVVDIAAYLDPLGEAALIRTYVWVRDYYNMGRGGWGKPKVQVSVQIRGAEALPLTGLQGCPLILTRKQAPSPFMGEGHGVRAHRTRAGCLLRIVLPLL